MKKKIFILLLIFFLYSLYAESIVSGFGVFYRTEYEMGLKTIKEDGFKILRFENIKNSNADQKLVVVDSFEYEGIPYISGIFCFDRDTDGKYYFTSANGYVDTDLIDNDKFMALSFALALEDMNKKYGEPNKLYGSKYGSDKDFIRYIGDNGGEIVLGIDDKLIIMYTPKGKKF